MHIISNIALISINETLIVQLISFLIFMFIMNRIMFRPLNSVMQERGEYFDNIQCEIDRFEKETEEIKKQLDDIELADRKEAIALRKKLEDGSKVEVNKIYLASKKDVSQLKRKVEVEIENKITEARKFLGREAEILSLSIIDKVLSWR